MARVSNAYQQAANPQLMSSQEAATARSVIRGISEEDLNRAAMLMTPAMAATPNMGQLTAVSSIGKPLTAAERREEAGIHAEIYGTTEDEPGEWYEYWDETERGYTYGDKSQLRTPSNAYVANAPAPISLMPTSTINPERPRTVAAGYDPQRQVLTVVFRDGTFYNYYEVPPEVWGSFRQVTSKGRFIKQFLDEQYQRGAANVTRLAQASREQLYRVSRGHQLYASPSKVTAMNYESGKRERHLGVSPRAQSYAPYRLGSNPSKNNGKAKKR